MDEQSVVERAYAFVEDMFGLEHANKRQPTDPSRATEETDLAPEEAAKLDPHTYKSVAEIYIEKARREHRE